MSTHTETNHGDGQDKWNIGAGYFEPEKKKMSDWLRRFGPKVNSDAMRRLLGIFKGYLGSKTNNLPPILGALLQQFVDIFDDAFLDNPAHPTDHHEEHEFSQAVTDWTNKVFNEAMERIKNSPTPKEEAKKIKAEFAEIMSVFEDMEQKVAEHANKKSVAAGQNTQVPAPVATPETSIPELLKKAWSAFRGPFLIYTGVVLVTILFALYCVVMVLSGVSSGDSHTIFKWGITLLIEIVVVGAVLLPAALGVNIIRAFARTFGGK